MAETKEKSYGISAGQVRIRIVLVLALTLLLPAVILFSSGMIHTRKAEALGNDFGGRIISYVPVIPNPLSPPTPLCPAHMVIVNYVKAGPKILGLYVLPGSVFKYYYSFLFNGANLFFFPASLSLGASVLGKDSPAPWVSCQTVGIPYPVVPLSQITGVYYIGTSKK